MNKNCNRSCSTNQIIPHPSICKHISIKIISTYKIYTDANLIFLTSIYDHNSWHQGDCIDAASLKMNVCLLTLYFLHLCSYLLSSNFSEEKKADRKYFEHKRLNATWQFTCYICSEENIRIGVGLDWTVRHLDSIRPKPSAFGNSFVFRSWMYFVDIIPNWQL